MRIADEQPARPGEAPAQVPRLQAALSLMQEALRIFDETDLSAHVAAHLQNAIDELRDELRILGKR